MTSATPSAYRGDPVAPPNGMNLIVSPVGADSDLRGALEDLRMGRYSAARDLLIRTGSNWTLLARRCQLLLSDPGARSVIKMWRDEEQHSRYASVLWARALTQGALQLHREGKSHGVVGRAAGMAHKEWQWAEGLWPESPEPWNGRLQLTQLPYDPRNFDPSWRTRKEPWDRLDDFEMHFSGPWPLWAEANRRHPGNRDAHHRMREYFLSRSGAVPAFQYSQWIVSARLKHPELLMLPLYSLMDVYRENHGQGQQGALGFWQTDQVHHFTMRALREWFSPIPSTEHPWLSQWDLNHLAYALVACGETGAAKWVFNALGPYVTPQPWKDVSDSLGRSLDWTDEFLRVRASVLR
ncbi:hypothetical protein PV735_45365 [Streptomyces turgidiscabies]|uniref:hypothetical protein n=1 Tax=Streptomyces turgidiscabies TaxID=85558 RepID=UPI00131EB998|nr:hypothetical protein [Streptomyces turgidiscabies]